MYRNHGTIPLTRPDSKIGDFVTDTGLAGVVFCDVQNDHAFAVWFQPKGWCSFYRYQQDIGERWLVAWRPFWHEGKLKVWLLHTAPNNPADMQHGTIEILV